MTDEAALTHATVSMVCGRIAHDLNNLLAAVDGYSEFVAQEVAEMPQALADIGEVRRAAAKGALFTRRLRQVGQLVDWTPEVVDLSGLVQERLDQQEEADGSGTRVERDLAPGLAGVPADRAQLELALGSLLDNAREAMPDGGELRVRTFDAGGGMAGLSVSDTGHGMTPEVEAQAFSAFFSTKGKAVGNGLGLFIVDAVARRAGGQVRLETTDGRGTTVTLLLPTG